MLLVASLHLLLSLVLLHELLQQLLLVIDYALLDLLNSVDVECVLRIKLAV